MILLYYKNIKLQNSNIINLLYYKSIKIQKYKIVIL